jgi:hypothetical protein
LGKKLKQKIPIIIPIPYPIFAKNVGVPAGLGGDRSSEVRINERHFL